jgi:hypothetical protein
MYTRILLLAIIGFGACLPAAAQPIPAPVPRGPLPVPAPDVRPPWSAAKITPAPAAWGAAKIAPAPAAWSAAAITPAPAAWSAAKIAPAPAAWSAAKITPVPAPWSAAQLQTLPPESWAPQDPADSLWRAARDALNRGDNARAASLYAQIRTASRFSASAFRAPSYYWEAFARQRVGSRAELQRGLEVLAALRRDHPQYEGMIDVDRLTAMINGQLAQLGSPTAARNVAETARAAAEESRLNRALRAAAPQAPDQQCDPTQLAAVEALSWMPADQALPILRRVMERRDCERMRETALFILSRAGGREAEEILLDALRNDPSTRVREAAVGWLASAESDRAAAELDNILRTSTERRLLEAAIFAVSQRQGARAHAMLRALATRANAPAEARASAIMLLGRNAEPETITFLRGMYAQAGEDRIREAILFAVVSRSGPGTAAVARTPSAGQPPPAGDRTRPPLDDATVDWLLGIALNERESVNMRTQALYLVGQNRVMPLSRLVELYGRMPDRSMKQQIMYAIARSTETDAIVRLMEIVRTERDEALRREGIYWIGQSSDPRRGQFLAELIGGS